MTDEEIADELERRIRERTLSPEAKQQLLHALQRHWEWMIGEATLAVVHSILARAAAGYPISTDELCDCLYAIYSSLPDEVLQ